MDEAPNQPADLVGSPTTVQDLRLRPARHARPLPGVRSSDGARANRRTLLDHSLYLYGSGIGNPNMHDPTNLPIIVAGGAGGGGAGLKGNRHIRFTRTTRPLQAATI